MLPAEQEPIRLPDIQSETVVTEGRKVQFRSGRELIVPHRFSFLWDQVKAGASLYTLSLRQRSQISSESTFLEIARFLHFLVDRELVDDLRLVHLSDAIRGEYSWPSSFATLYESEHAVSSWGRSPGRQTGAQKKWGSLVDLGVAFLSMLGVVVSVVGYLATWRQEAPLSAVSLFVAWFSAGVLGRTLTAVLRGLLAKSGGDAGELYWSIDILGPSLSFQPLVLTGPYRRAADFIAVFLVPFMAIAVAMGMRQLLGPDAVSLAAVSAMSWMVLAFVAHPYLKSAVTGSLRVWNRAPLAYREDDELREIEAFHRIGGIFAVVFFLFSLAGVSLLHYPRHGQSLLATVAFLGVVVISALAFLEPYLATRNPASGRNVRRRLWATRAKAFKLAVSDRDSWGELPVLRQLTQPVRQRLLKGARSISVGRGRAVCRQGDRDRSLYIVLSGELAVAKSFEGRRRKVVALLTEGAVFGETAFFFATPRTADVVATEDSVLVEIPYQESMRDLDLASSDEFQFRVWLLQALSGSGILKELPSEAMDTLIFAGQRKTFQAGETVFTEGAPGTACYFIAQGQASVVKGGAKIRELRAGDAFGEIALLKPQLMRTATVVADSDLLCMELTADVFWTTLASRLPLGVEIERLALRRLKADEKRVYS